MNLLKAFDIAIASGEETQKGYRIGGQEPYDNYLSNEAWGEYLAGMSDEHRSQYGNGSGGELEEKNGRPPKMAAFASSSRMIYQLSKDIPGFCFEMQLPTLVGGTANLDGYRACESGYLFVEAKCREPYSHKAIQTIRQNYKPLYAYLREKMPGVFSCVMEDVSGTRDMRVAFFCHGEIVAHFDIKQMICHMLGIANRMLSQSAYGKSVLFLYLLYNPNRLPLPQESRAEIVNIYQDTCMAAKSYHIDEMFGHIVNFLVREKGISASEDAVAQIRKSFQFVLCDQNDYRKYAIGRK